MNKIVSIASELMTGFVMSWLMDDVYSTLKRIEFVVTFIIAIWFFISQEG